ncbi:GntR family transcriptional regulator [Pararhizobium sp. IMCC21322]|uniref:GntR family transcriptional regulator n=1 Tax=Pararhizobium sp. IMCC21322 TaxID=3067903 RepID=UPI002741CB7A|nr:GntR family transcriptional regulator [Pararhizobium sp. IMCC21322]
MTAATTPKQNRRKRGSGATLVYQELRDEIIDLVLPPGSAIDEIQLAARFDMSRTPIREALVRLAAEGLVTTLPNRSSVVSNIDFLNLNALSLMHRVTTRLAAQYRTDDDLEDIRAKQAIFAQAVETRDVLAMIATNRDFHAAIAAAARNTYFETLFNRVLDEGRRIMRLYYSSFDDCLPEQYLKEHDLMIEAIAAGDVETADQVASAHADQIVKQIQQLIASDRRQKIPL